eukprot:TRINITY_DN3840_c0_g1_i1.p2 TRINITY_DN3840_c0_g1~~TRINITY_DN3840_c0_g1_i1.p2  ORF type:complete len:727 (+),score=202.06 TRINITY_DN3840_c0_g1_i1:98-2278(+)
MERTREPSRPPILAQEQLGNLKKLIDASLHEQGVYDQIRGILVDFLKEDERKGDASAVDDEKSRVFELLQQRGVLQQVIASLQVKSPFSIAHHEHIGATPAAPLSSFSRFGPIDPKRSYLFLKVVGGHAFSDQLLSSSRPPSSKRKMVVYVQFMSQRFSTVPVSCSVDPVFGDSFLLEIEDDPGVYGDWDGLLLDGDYPLCALRKPGIGRDPKPLAARGSPVHFVVVELDEDSGRRVFVGGHFLEWRKVLRNEDGCVSLAVELGGPDPDVKVPTGVLHVSLQLVPRPRQEGGGKRVVAKSGLSYDASDVDEMIREQKEKMIEREKRFLGYAKEWWKEYLDIRSIIGEEGSGFAHRMVKIFGRSESGASRPVFSYVFPMMCDRIVESPRHAARLVSLVPVVEEDETGAAGDEDARIGGIRTDASGGGGREIWWTMHSFLAMGRGRVHQHAVLLCSLLLGFGLDAYVCLGLRRDGKGHAWVMTYQPRTESSSHPTVLFWEPTTGHRFHPRGAPIATPGKSVPRHPYQTLDCIFNHTSFYANSQASNDIRRMDLDLGDTRKWKAMDRRAIAMVKRPPFCAIGPSDGANCVQTEVQIEASLKDAVEEIRSHEGLDTFWDDGRGYQLGQALVAYEYEKLAGVPFGNDEFQQSMKHSIPEGYTFKGFPVQFTHTNVRRMFYAMQQSAVCKDILMTRGEDVAFALRCRLFSYAENSVVMWVMLSVQYRALGAV